MNLNWKIFATLAIVFVASLGAAVAFFHYFPKSVIGDLAGIPAIIALFGALFQLGRDSIAFDRSVRLEEHKNRFTVGATSHMADVAFDKHVEFSEKYVSKMEEALVCLYKEGPTEKVLPLATDLFRIRRAASLWLTSEIENDLERYETTIIRIGNHSRLTTSFPEWDDRQKYVQEMFTLYSEIVGDKTDTKGQPTKGDVATAKIIDGLRAALGIGELTRLRSELIKQASENVKGVSAAN